MKNINKNEVYKDNPDKRYAQSKHSGLWMFITYIVGILCFISLTLKYPIEKILVVIAAASPFYTIALVISGIKNKSMTLPIISWIISAAVFIYVASNQEVLLKAYPSANSLIRLYQPSISNPTSQNASLNVRNEDVSTQYVNPIMLSPGDIIVKNSFIVFEGVTILNTGEHFEVTNNREDIIRMSYNIIGTKKDGSYEILATAWVSGPDMTTYNKDLEENGWAIKHYTNMIRPGETLYANIDIIDIGFQDLPSYDVDKDGYYDIKFVISPQVDENTIIVSSDDPKSETYRLPVKN